VFEGIFYSFTKTAVISGFSINFILQGISLINNLG
jgi:hypothetical protein